MLEKKHQNKIRTIVELEKTITEILVANGRSIEPFIKVFIYSGENVAQSPLGTLAGVFEISEQNEDSAYIVNFLASVAKKEYFNNPRRGAIESFEAALHKINFALAELVKHGNIAWLGKFHGAIGILEKNNFHFSATGKAKILLLRNNNFSEISSGLASPESHVHPIKTFVEVSSGRLMVRDKIVFTSPELLDLLPIEDLEKNSLRMDKDHFGQFLRTVLVNELDMAGAIVIDFQEGKPISPPPKQEEKTVNNVFSQKAFVPKIKTEKTDSYQKENKKETPAKEEYVDSKTGHIYIQGNTLEKSPTNYNLERIKLSLQNISHGVGTFFISQGKFFRKGKKVGLIFFTVLKKNGHIITRKTTRLLRKQWKKVLSLQPPIPPQETSASQINPAPSPQGIIPCGKDHISIHPRSKTTGYSGRCWINPAPAPQDIKPSVNDYVAINASDKLTIYSEKYWIKNFHTIFSSTQKIIGRGIDFLLSSWNWISLKIQILLDHILSFWKGLSLQKRKIVLAGSIVCMILVIGLFFLIRPSSNKPIPVAEAPKPQIVVPISPLATEKNVRLLGAPVTFTTQKNLITKVVLLDNEIYLIAEKNIISLNDKKQYALPNNSSARLATPMDHLSLIFLYTDGGELFAWSPISHTFAKNSLTLPPGAVVRDIDTYLTYLYVLDDTTNQIYRFPRAEGGFGPGTAWLKDDVMIEDASKIAVNETIFLAPDNTVVKAFFHGRYVKNLESPKIPLSLTAIFTHQGLINVYALDTENKRVLVWNQDGALLAQYFSEQLSTTKTIAVNEKTNEAFITTSSALLSFKLNP